MQGQLQKATQEWASLFTNLPWRKWVQWAPRWLTVLMVILVAKAASDMTWLIFAPAESTAIKKRNVNSTQQAPTVQHRLRSVASLHLFGVALKTEPVKAAPIEASETRLKLTLKGVFAANTPEQAMAIIADARGEEKVYKKSETIFSGVTLYEIYPDKVILERSGSFETLSLPTDKESISEASSSYNSRTQSNRAHRTRVDGNKVKKSVSTRRIRAGNRIKSFKQELTENPQKFMQEARFEPVFGDDNQIKGYKFEHTDRRLLQALGLRPGDVIVEVNGQPVSDPSTLTSLFSELANVTELNLAIERSGRRENLNISM